MSRLRNNICYNHPEVDFKPPPLIPIYSLNPSKKEGKKSEGKKKKKKTQKQQQKTAQPLSFFCRKTLPFSLHQFHSNIPQKTPPFSPISLPPFQSFFLGGNGGVFFCAFWSRGKNQKYTKDSFLPSPLPLSLFSSNLDYGVVPA